MRELVLIFLHQHGLPLPPVVIHRGLQVENTLAPSHRTIMRILDELTENGEIMRCDLDALDDGRIEPLAPGEDPDRAWYFITDAGRERIGVGG